MYVYIYIYTYIFLPSSGVLGCESSLRTSEPPNLRTSARNLSQPRLLLLPQVLKADNLPDRAYLSIRAGDVRKQAAGRKTAAFRTLGHQRVLADTCQLCATSAPVLSTYLSS